MTQLYVYLKTRLAEHDGERGATAVEYGLMVALIAVFIVVSVDRARRQARRRLPGCRERAALGPTRRGPRHGLRNTSRPGAHVDRRSPS